MKNNRTSRNLQSGQAIFVIALVMVGLIGALGLAVDGGGMAFMYRDAQNASDAAALAAAYAACAGGDNASITNAATTAAAENGFSTGGTTSVVVTRDGSNPNLISVAVNAVKPAYFIQLVYPNGLNITARATAQCTPGSTAGSGAGYALVGLGPTSGVSASCHGGCQAVEGNNLNVIGNVVIGNNEAADWAGGVTVTGTTTTTSSVINPMAGLTLAQYQPGGAIYESIPAASRVIHGSAASPTGWSFSPTSAGALAPIAGLHVVYGNVTINLGNSSVKNLTIPPFTVVATGTIRITGFTKGVTAFVNDLLAFSPKDLGANTCDANTVIYVNGGGTSRGIVYSPNGQSEILYTGGGTWTGAMIGRWVDWWNSGATKSTLQSLPSTVPPIVAMVS